MRSHKYKNVRKITIQFLPRLGNWYASCMYIMYRAKNGEKFQEKIKKIPSHFHLYVGTGMQTACRFCTEFKNQKKFWGYPNPKTKTMVLLNT